jgi:hypothetical protein
MPRAAIAAAGDVDVLPLDQIGPHIGALCREAVA